MAIPTWLSKVAADEANKGSIDPRLADLLQKYNRGELDDKEAQTVQELQELWGIFDTALNKLTGTLKKEAKAPAKTMPAPKMPAADELTPEEKKVNEMIAEVPPPATPAKAEGKPGKLPPKVKQPETTKWKEIRFNKRTGTWQVVVTIRHTRNFLSENEAVDFTKKASLDNPSENA